MAEQHVSLETVEDFLAQKRIAMAGISRSPTSFSAILFNELCRRGYDVVPVNPNAHEIQGRQCFARVQDIHPLVDAALLMTSPKATDQVVEDCIEAGVRRIWMFRATGKGSVSDHAVAVCRDEDIRVIAGECPFMFLPNAGFVHRMHRLMSRMTRRYPRHAQA